ncbi:site-specific integrase [Staphylococcus sp. IVB6238]|uniref:site-specific integrase n=1 Tax=Staphylococcus sp. IVB6238 TaxID=2989770 RepID=UPI0021D0C761|nr:site-specific integrase [Staphylococcus sp. IVB6238]UXR73354.1 site-specific integrase [Staphylococcus sp. IVB6238]
MIKKYKKKDGSTAYMFIAYLGIDPVTRKQKRTTRRGFKTEREAKIAEAKLQTEIQNNGFLNTEITTFNQVYELWLQQYRNTVKESTYQQVLTAFKCMILVHFGNMPIKEITVPYCQKVVNEWYNTYSETKKGRIYASNVFDYAISLKIISDNPMKHVKPPRKKRNEKPETMKYYSSDELQQFLELVKDNPLKHAMFRTLAFTGMRRGELMALMWQDIDFNNQTININKTLTNGIGYKDVIDTPKTKSSKRIISLDSKTLEVLKTWRTQQRIMSLKHGHNTSHKQQEIFTNVETNKRLNRVYANETLNLICKQNDFKRITVHGFRHTHCSLLFEAGLTVQEVQDRLGHADINTTMDIYAHVTEKQREKVAEKFANYINF